MIDCSSKTEKCTGRSSSATAELAALTVVLVLTTIVLSKDISVGGLRDGDTAVHAMDGVLIHDWVAAGPTAWLSPLQFAKEQYGHYPCLGIGRHYPPGFAMVEAGFFALLGISPITSRLCVLFFGLFAAAGVYTFARTFSDRAASTLAAVATMTLPAVTFWGRQTMLEVPTLSILAWTAVAFAFYLRDPSGRRLLVVLGMSTLSLLFRQHAVFVFGAVAVTLFYCNLRGIVPRRHFVISAIVAITMIVLITLSFEGAAARMIRGRATYPSLWEFDALTFYLRQLPIEVGAWTLGAGVVGLVIWPRRYRPLAVFMFAWFFGAYIMLTAADQKWDRFLFVALLPAGVCAAVALTQVFSCEALARWRLPTTAVACITLCAIGLGRPVQHYPDYGSVVSAYKEEIRGRVILFGGTRDNHFVFSVRQHLPPREAIVIRSSKLLYLCNTVPSVDFESIVASKEDLAGLMRRFAFRYVFTEKENRFDVGQESMLQDYLANGGDYRRAATHALHADAEPTSRDSTIDVYRLAQPLTRSAEYFESRIPRSDMIVRVRLPQNEG